MPLDKFKGEHRQLLLEAGQHYSSRINGMWSGIHRAIKTPTLPTPLAKLSRAVEALHNAMVGSAGAAVGTPFYLEMEHRPIIKRVVTTHRRFVAEEIRQPLQRTFDQELITQVRNRLAPLDSFILDQKWFSTVSAEPEPPLSQFLTLRDALEVLGTEVVLSDRKYDDKFPILQAASLVEPDMRYWRRMCELRAAPVTLAYLDIDNFKALNTKYHEDVVDRDILPKFLSAIEAFVFSRGTAYQEGGDECVLILPNMTTDAAVRELELLRQTVSKLGYPQAEVTTTISIGFVTLHVDSYLTNDEAKGRATAAKAFAKKQGRNCVATFTAGDLSDTDIHVVSGLK